MRFTVKWIYLDGFLIDENYIIVFIPNFRYTVKKLKLVLTRILSPIVVVSILRIESSTYILVPQIASIQNSNESVIADSSSLKLETWKSINHG